MKILSAEQVRSADAYTIAHEPISSVNLMERAAKACVEKLISFLFVRRDTPFDVYCGPGNNGGDGLAIARLLLEKQFQVRVFMLPAEKYTADFQVNLQRLKEKGFETVLLSEKEALPHPEQETIILDALFGTGLSRGLDGFAANVVAHLNKQGCTIISIDMPSGLFADARNEGFAIVKATHTLTFQQPKLSLLLPDNSIYSGLFHVLDIGLNQQFMEALPSRYVYITREDAHQLLNPRGKFSHKGNYGHALLVAGSYGKAGAAILAAGACLRSGVGLLTLRVPVSAVEPLQAAVPEAMVLADEEAHFVTSIPHLDPFNTIGVGPGLGMEKQTQHMLKLLIQQCAGPMVLDADALNILGENKTWISFLPPNSILTPHVKEFERLCGKYGNSFDRLDAQREFAIKHRIILVLKGANTSIACPDGNVYFNSTGNPGMAKGGSGDVLTGIITGLLAQGYVPHEAALFGVYLHGLSGDIAAEKLSMEGMVAGDIVAALPEGFKRLHE
jgi:hydroxyethylthiazole kinase-like uncharacterized protein yjeF